MLGLKRSRRSRNGAKLNARLSHGRPVATMRKRVLFYDHLEGWICRPQKQAFGQFYCRFSSAVAAFCRVIRLRFALLLLRTANRLSDRAAGIIRHHEREE